LLDWTDLIRQTKDKDRYVRSGAVAALGKIFPQVPDKKQAWQDLHRLTQDEDSFVRWSIADVLGEVFSQVPDRDQAQKDLHNLVQDNDSDVRASAVDALCNVFSQVPDKDQARQDLHKLTRDNDTYVRSKAIDALGKLSDEDPSQQGLHILPQNQHKDNLRGRTNFKDVIPIVMILIIIITFAANLTAILDYFNIHLELKKSPSSNEVKNELLDFSDKTFTDLFLMKSVNNITIMKNNCVEEYAIYDKRRASCLTYIGQFYGSLFQYRSALNCLEEANEIDPKISDPYFAIGNIYYDLAIVDLIKREKYYIYPDNMSVILYPDDKSKNLFNKILEEYRLGETYASNYYDLNLSPMFLISWTTVTYRKQQINDVLRGSSYISINNKSYEILSFALMATIIHPKDEKVEKQCRELMLNILTYMSESPEKFSGIPFSSYHDENGIYMNFNQ